MNIKVWFSLLMNFLIMVGAQGASFTKKGSILISRKQESVAYRIVINAKNGDRVNDFDTMSCRLSQIIYEKNKKTCVPIFHKKVKDFFYQSGSDTYEVVIMYEKKAAPEYQQYILSFYSPEPKSVLCDASMFATIHICPDIYDVNTSAVYVIPDITKAQPFITKAKTIIGAMALVASSSLAYYLYRVFSPIQPSSTVQLPPATTPPATTQSHSPKCKGCGCDHSKADKKSLGRLSAYDQEVLNYARKERQQATPWREFELWALIKLTVWDQEKSRQFLAAIQKKEEIFYKERENFFKINSSMVQEETGNPLFCFDWYKAKGSFEKFRKFLSSFCNEGEDFIITMAPTFPTTHRSINRYNAKYLDLLTDDAIAALEQESAYYHVRTLAIESGFPDKAIQDNYKISHPLSSLESLTREKKALYDRVNDGDVCGFLRSLKEYCYNQLVGDACKENCNTSRGFIKNFINALSDQRKNIKNDQEMLKNKPDGERTATIYKRWRMGEDLEVMQLFLVNAGLSTQRAAILMRVLSGNEWVLPAELTALVIDYVVQDENRDGIYWKSSPGDSAAQEEENKRPHYERIDYSEAVNIGKEIVFLKEA